VKKIQDGNNMRLKIQKKLLVWPSVISLSIDTVAAQTIIYIREDGAIEPETAPIFSLDNVIYTLTGDIEGSIVIDRDNIIVDGAGHLLESGEAEDSIGVDINGRFNVTIDSLKVRNFFYGIRLDGSENTISRNEITSNENAGIWVVDLSTDNNLYLNTIRNNWYGLRIDASLGNEISENTIEDSYYGISLDWSSDNNIINKNILNSNTFCIAVFGSSGNMISENLLTSNDNALYLEWASENQISRNEIKSSLQSGIKINDSSNNNVFVNNIENNTYGIELYKASDNNFYHNNFINNSQNVYIPSWQSGYENVWDDNYPSGGNYWSDYEDADEFSGVDQNVQGSDGIWDNPYIIDEDNQDNYPIVPEFTTMNSILILLIVTMVAGFFKRFLLK
jgi:parallel beta-helix repeat protein